MGHNTPHIKRKCLLEIKGKMELFKLEFRQEEDANSHGESKSLQLSGSSSLKNPGQKHFLRSEFQSVKGEKVHRVGVWWPVSASAPGVARPVAHRPGLEEGKLSLAWMVQSWSSVSVQNTNSRTVWSTGLV